MAYPRPYFAYGLNMARADMRARCPRAVLLGRARLPRFRFIFNIHGVASVVPAEGDEVRGLLWSITGHCERSLDRFEGVADGFYTKHALRVESEAGEADEAAEALVYVAADATPGPPRPHFLEWVLEAAAANGLPDAYVARLEAQWGRPWVRR